MVSNLQRTFKLLEETDLPHMRLYETIQKLIFNAKLSSLSFMSCWTQKAFQRCCDGKGQPRLECGLKRGYKSKQFPAQSQNLNLYLMNEQDGRFFFSIFFWVDSFFLLNIPLVEAEF